jgi:hypothetical protein
VAAVRGQECLVLVGSGWSWPSELAYARPGIDQPELQCQASPEVDRVPTFELATFTVREGAESALLSERPEMIAALRQAFPAALAAWLTRQDDGTWLDVILWRGREEAEEAARRIGEVPEANRWFRHIAESKGLRHVEVAHEALFDLRRLGQR